MKPAGAWQALFLVASARRHVGAAECLPLCQGFLGHVLGTNGQPQSEFALTPPNIRMVQRPTCLDGRAFGRSKLLPNRTDTYYTLRVVNMSKSGSPLEAFLIKIGHIHMKERTCQIGALFGNAATVARWDVWACGCCKIETLFAGNQLGGLAHSLGTKLIQEGHPLGLGLTFNNPINDVFLGSARNGFLSSHTRESTMFSKCLEDLSFPYAESKLLAGPKLTCSWLHRHRQSRPQAIDWDRAPKAMDICLISAPEQRSPQASWS